MAVGEHGRRTIMWEPTPQSTPVEVRNFEHRLGVDDRVLGMGSCFAEAVTQQLSQLGHPCTRNPAGTLYNPISVAQAMRLALSEQRPEPQAYGRYRDRFFHPLLGSRIAANDLGAAQNKCEAALTELRQALGTSKWLLVTFGTARVYRDRSRDLIVGNCQQRPSADFCQQQLSCAEIVDAWSSLVIELRAHNPKLQILLSVSPIRHGGMGLIDHQRSKARLLLACESLETHGCLYFPAYEVFMDELRDYRWYAEDLRHPSPAAVDLVWRRFVEQCCDAPLQQQLAEAHKLERSLQHRFLSPGSRSAQAYVEGRLRAVETFLKAHPKYDPRPWQAGLAALRQRAASDEPRGEDHEQR